MRLREIDFLRGLAILLVLFRHHPFIPFLKKIGWIGVDLFFVLSGFLVSGLLFQAYRKYNTFTPGRFLIRRGLKIYPLFYLYLGTTVVIEQIFFYGVDKMALLSDIFFIQSYSPGIWPHTWSLAVEEHFYVSLPFFILFLIRTRQLEQVKNITFIFSGIALVCLLLRTYTVNVYPYQNLTHHFATHLRIDSLLFGVLISYYYHFKKEAFNSFFLKHRSLLYISSALLLSPFLILPEEHPFTNTLGVTCIYLGFGTILSLFLADPHINRKLNLLLGNRLVNLISYTGYCSYAVYLFHLPLAQYVQLLELSIWADFLTYFFGSVALGIIISETVEHRIMKLRDKWYPKQPPSPLGKVHRNVPSSEVPAISSPAPIL